MRRFYSSPPYAVAIMALGSGADTPLVLAVQMLLLFAVVLAGSLLGRWWSL